MTISSKQRKQLRAIGQRIDPQFTVGKAGLKETFTAEVNVLLSRLELIKVRCPAGDPRERKALVAKLAETTASESVGGTGRNFLFYRPNPELVDSDRIDTEEQDG